jgi:hypothetical protein
MGQEAAASLHTRANEEEIDGTTARRKRRLPAHLFFQTALFFLTEREQAPPSPFFARAPRDPTPRLRPGHSSAAATVDSALLRTTPRASALCAEALQQRPAPPFPPIARAECRGVLTPVGMMV